MESIQHLEASLGDGRQIYVQKQEEIRRYQEETERKAQENKQRS
jgi:hypothetical protein